MPFNIGSIFSPQMLQMVEQEKDRRQQNLGLQASLYRAREDDRFRNRQLSANVEQNDLDRASRERMSRETNDTRLELGDVQSSYRDALLTNKERAIDEKARQFDMMLGINQQKADAATTTAKAAGVSAGARADQTALNEKVEFGTGTADNPSPGSKAAGRAGLEDYRSARAALANMQIEALQQKLTGMLPEQIDGRKRTAILQAAQDLKTMQFKVNSVTSARNLGIGLIRALRNPVTGSFNDKDTAAAVNALAHDLFGSLQQVNEIYAAEFLEAFNEAGTKESGIKKDSGPSMTDDQRLQRAKDVMNALREKRRKELEGQAPDPTGR